MKFARYLEDTQTPEWQKAYIDYRGLKKCITAIRRSQEQRTSTDSNSTSIQANDPTIEQTAESAVLPRENGRPRSTRFMSTLSARKGTILRSRKFSRLKDEDPLSTPLPLCQLIPLLSSEEVAFFHALDVEVEKIETFYLEREQEMRLRGAELSDQFVVLSDHRKAYYAAYPIGETWKDALTQPKVKFRLPHFLRVVEPSTDEAAERPTVIASNPTTSFLSPDEYRHAKKTLRKAVQEHYRGLETLHNYRILNYTGFRKVLKKFEKATKILAQETYMSEKVNPSIGSGASVNAMIEETEALFAARFSDGNKKRAMKRLRGGNRSESHHFSTFRAGLSIGSSLPALVYGVYECFQPQTREEIVAWPALLRIYGTFFVALFFALLVGINLLIFTRARINYVFIFGLDLRTRLDNRQYFETPALLLSTLCYAFWFSFARIGSTVVSPHTWPCIWLAIAATIMINPLPVMNKSSRFWLIKQAARLLLSGTRRVEFSSFWLGDQFCSLVYTLSNMYFVACVYSSGFNANWKRCGASSPQWMVPLVLGMIPFLVRLVQSIKRYADSGLATHLINGGKYASGILANTMYFLWRHQGSTRNSTFVFWVILNTIYSSYALIWDFLMDWSVLRPHSKYPLLRPELVYSGHISLYYIAIVSNALLRFTWLLYIPQGGMSTDLRAFIFATLEAIRRFNWNTYRLENEHLGNVDQYRVTREIPLPYATEDSSRRDGGSISDDEDNDDNTETGRRRRR